MTDLNNLTAEQLQALLVATQGKQAQSQPVLSGWAQPVQQPTGLNIQGVSIPVSVQSSKGKVRVQIILGAEVGQSPIALQQAIEQMIGMGVDVDAWQSQSNSNSNSGNGWGNGNSGGGGNWQPRNNSGWRR